MRANPIRELWAVGKPALNGWITLPATLAAAKKAGPGMRCTSAEYARAMIARGFDVVTVISGENRLARGVAERAKLA